ncbi:MAG: carbon-nitrogen hydrolase family protein [Acidobacteriota bacterium]|nr:MAG: carbon-nitrogen hydrolase family protein [Acidobacteriota bacterium]
MTYWVLGVSFGIAGLAAVVADKEPEIVRVGLVQMDGRALDKEYNLERAEKLIRQAAARGARIISTPESAVQGYPRVSLPEGVSPESPEIQDRRQEILAAAETIPGPATDRFSRLARELGVWLVFGIDENRDGRLYNTAVLMDSDGAITGKYSKVHLQNWMLASGVNRGDGFPVWDAEIDGVKVRVGIQVCYDIQHPESSRELALGGAEIMFVPYCTTDFARPLLVHLFQTRALENRAFVVRVNYGGNRNNGTSSIIDFEGATQDELDRSEGVLVGDLNITALRAVRNTWNKVYGPANRHPSAYKRLISP